MAGLESTPEYQQSLRMQPACNRVYQDVFNASCGSIIRYVQDDGPHILDTEFAIDLRVVLPNGSRLSGQEKALSYKYHHYRTFTMEFYQNRYTKEHGEFFKIASQFYLSGYSDETGKEFIEWHMIELFPFMNWLKNVPVSRLESRLKPAGGSRAMFLPIEYDKIPREFVFASGKGPGTTVVWGELKDMVCRN